MKHFEIPKPIGLTAICQEIDQTCSRADMYKRCGLRPGHLIVPMDPGSGRTTLLEYMTERYKEAGVLRFCSGLDDFIELTLDGSLLQLQRAFATIDAAAIYTNEFSDLIGMDISAIASHLGETQLSEFLKNCKRVCDHACVVFFVHSVPSGNEEKLLRKLCETVENIKQIPVKPYTKDEICSLIIKTLGNHGTEVKNETAFRSILSDIVSEFHISSVHDAIHTAKELIAFADFTNRTVMVDEKSLKRLVAKWQRESERSDVK